MATESARHVTVDGHELRLTNLEKVIYPRAEVTKGAVIHYYATIAPALLPHLRGRPLTLKRYPNGVDAPYFYEKRCPSHRPGWIATSRVPSRDGPIDFCVIDDVAGLVWVANLASLELHVSLSAARTPARPTAIVFDLDPGAPAGLLECAELALELRARLESDGLRSWVKASGGKGLQLYAPLNHPRATYDRTKSYSRRLAEELEAEMPARVISRQTRSMRAGKILVDWSQNDRHKTTVCAYSLRAAAEPRVAAPLRWEEIDRAVEIRDAGGLVIDAETAIARVETDGDLFAPVAELTQEPPTRRRS